MKKLQNLLIGLAVAAVAACDYTVPLVVTPKIDIDRAGIGLWERSGGNAQEERLLVLPLGDREYLVSYPAGAGNAMYARGTLWRGAGTTLVQLDWIGTARGKLPDGERTYQFASYAIEDNVLRIRLLNPDVVDRDIPSTSRLAGVIEAKRDDLDLFRKPWQFKRVVDTR